MNKIEKQKKNVSELLELIKKNPDLEIIPMVDYDVIGDDSYSSWAGNWGNARIDEYYNADERIYFKYYDFEDVTQQILDKLTDEECKDLDDEQIEKLAEQKADALPWVKAIVVNITA